uniref:Uncharacterized protein n=1 Tax=Timema genevievae TaxID=629358 RepID=A0A7R9PPA5_TIMGE|nr:unnamed protein product [Timema genevievae]
MQDLLNRTQAKEPLYWYKTLEQYYYRDEWELFDLKKDADELHNLATVPSYQPSLSPHHHPTSHHDSCCRDSHPTSHRNSSCRDQHPTTPPRDFLMFHSDSHCRNFLMFHHDSRCQDFFMFHNDLRCRDILLFHHDSCYRDILLFYCDSRCRNILADLYPTPTHTGLNTTLPSP